MQKLFILVLLLVIVPAVMAQDAAISRSAPPDPAAVRLVEVVGGFRRPLLVTHAGDERLFIVEQYGRIFVYDSGELLPAPFLDVTDLITSRGNEQGLLGLAFHPDYAATGTFFINYTDVNGDTAVVRYHVSADDPNLADASSAEIVLQIAQPYGNHNGGHLAFGPDGYLYVGMGDGGAGGDPHGNGQDTAALLGKMLRLDVNGSEGYAVPADNPFVGNPAYAPEIWALGLRNPWRFTFDRATGDLYIADVGQNAWEEVNFQAADSVGGENYGWNILEGTHEYSGEIPPSDLVMPFYEYSHGEGCSVTGGYVYRGDAIPDLRGVYLFGDYCSGTIWASYRDEAGSWTTTRFLQVDGTISSFGEDVHGELYLVSHGGTVFRFEPA